MALGSGRDQVKAVRIISDALVVLTLALAGVLFVAAPAHAIASRTVAFWSMDELPGSTVLIDSSGNGRNGTIGSDITLGARYEGATAHRFATHLPSDQQEFPGHINRVPHNTEFNPQAGDFSITVRLRTTYSFGNIMQKGQGATAGGYWKLEAPSGMPRCLFRGGDGSSRTGYSNTPINDGRWHTIHCNRTSSFVEMYVDGVRTSRLNGPTGTIANSWELTIGGKGACDGVDVTCDYFVGDIDFVRIEKGSSGTANAPPVANLQAACTGLICSFDGRGSTDSDGAIQRHVWDFGDGVVQDTVSVPTTVHTFAEPGTYQVRLTVTDDRGVTDTTAKSITVQPIPELISFVAQATSNANAANHQVIVPGGVQAGDIMLLFFSQNNAATLTPPTGWTLLDTVSGGYGRTTVWRRTAQPGDAGTTVRVSLAQLAKGNLVLAAYRGVDQTAPVAFVGATDPASTAIRVTPAAPVAAVQSWGVSYWMHGDSVSTSLTPPSTVAVRSNSSQTGSGRVTGLLADSNASLPAGTYGGLVAAGSAASTTTTTWTVVLRPDTGPPPPNQPPAAALAVTCGGLDCSADSAGSTDPDGSIASYAWDFGDGTDPVAGTATVVRHNYTSAGTYTVTLTVTDDDGATDTTARQVTVAPVQDLITYVGQSTANANAGTHGVGVPSAVRAGDALLLFLSTSALLAPGSPTGVTGWQLLDTVDGGSARTTVWSKVAAAGDAGAQVRVTLPSQVKGNLIVAAYRGTDATAPVLGHVRTGTTSSSANRVTPVISVPHVGSWAVSYWAHRDSSTSTLAPPPDVAVRSNSSQTGGGRVTVLLADSDVAVPLGGYGGLTATAAASSTSATTWTLLLKRS